LTLPHTEYKMPTEIQNFEEGSFYKNDRVEAIEANKDSGEIIIESLFFKVKWNRRDDGVIPQPSYASYNSIKKFEPYLLLEFWENILTKNQK